MRPIPRPIVDLRLAHGHHEARLVALIDTGAPVTLFDAAMAEAVGIRLGQPGAPSENVTILGGTRKAERHMVHLTLPPFDDVSWETEVLFLREDLDLAFAGCLGTLGFLDRWVVSFNYYDSYFVVEERDSFQERMPKDMSQEFLKFDSEWAPPGQPG